jgi:predicted TIM-barrel fold metal-dependent hydrolase
MKNFGIDRAVLVQPSVYGFDNAVLLEALASLPRQLRGVVVVPPETSPGELNNLHRAGVRGVRINRLNPGGLPIAAVEELSRRIAGFGWHLQMLLSVEDTPELAEIIARASVPVVVDHLGFLVPDRGIAAAGFQNLLRVAEAGNCWVKLSAPYRMTTRHETLEPFVAALVGCAADRLLWATDWPHSERFDWVPDDADLVELVERWLPTADLRRLVLIENPNRLYRYS